MGKILKIEERKPQPATIPDGVYTGVWGGNIITLRCGDNVYELETDEGVR